MFTLKCIVISLVYYIYANAMQDMQIATCNIFFSSFDQKLHSMHKKGHENMQNKYAMQAVYGHTECMQTSECCPVEPCSTV